MAEYLIQDSTLDAIVEAINQKAGTQNAMTPAQMVTAIENIPSGGGTTITDGIVVKVRDSYNYASEVDFYGTKVYTHQFYNRAKIEGAWIDLVTVNFKNVVTEIGASGFFACGALTSLDFSAIETLGTAALQDCGFTSIQMPELLSVSDSSFLGCTALLTLQLPKLTSLNANTIFRGCTALTNVEVGSVGYGVVASRNNIFQYCTQAGLTITVYTTGAYADTLLANIRNGATNATIIVKASVSTTYNNTAFNAGDTMINSEVVP